MNFAPVPWSLRIKRQEAPGLLIGIFLVSACHDFSLRCYWPKYTKRMTLHRQGGRRHRLLAGFREARKRSSAPEMEHYQRATGLRKAGSSRLAPVQQLRLPVRVGAREIGRKRGPPLP
jgi:hypothetical protein